MRRSTVQGLDPARGEQIIPLETQTNPEVQRKCYGRGSGSNLATNLESPTVARRDSASTADVGVPSRMALKITPEVWVTNSKSREFLLCSFVDPARAAIRIIAAAFLFLHKRTASQG